MYAITTDHHIVEVLATFDDEFYAELSLEEIERFEAHVRAEALAALQKLRDGTATVDDDGDIVDENGAHLIGEAYALELEHNDVGVCNACHGAVCDQPVPRYGPLPELTTEQIDAMWAAPPVTDDPTEPA